MPTRLDALVQKSGSFTALVLRDPLSVPALSRPLVAALAASIFHFKEYEVAAVKDFLAEKGIIVRKT